MSAVLRTLSLVWVFALLPTHCESASPSSPAQSDTDRRVAAVRDKIQDAAMLDDESEAIRRVASLVLESGLLQFQVDERRYYQCYHGLRDWVSAASNEVVAMGIELNPKRNRRSEVDNWLAGISQRCDAQTVNRVRNVLAWLSSALEPIKTARLERDRRLASEAEERRIADGKTQKAEQERLAQAGGASSKINATDGSANPAAKMASASAGPTISTVINLAESSVTRQKLALRPGADGAVTLDGSFDPGKRRYFNLEAKKGQNIQIRLKSDNGVAVFHVYPPGEGALIDQRIIPPRRITVGAPVTSLEFAATESGTFVIGIGVPKQTTITDPVGFRLQVAMSGADVAIREEAHEIQQAFDNGIYRAAVAIDAAKRRIQTYYSHGDMQCEAWIPGWRDFLGGAQRSFAEGADKHRLHQDLIAIELFRTAEATAKLVNLGGFPQCE